MTALLPRLVLVASVFVSIGAGFWLAQSAWRLWAPGQPAVLWDQWTTPAQASTTDLAALRDIDPAAWFGERQAPVLAPSPPPVRVTELPLTLQGVLAAADPAQGSALIAQRGRDAELFRPGDQIFGAAVLRAVYHDSVVLERNGQPEILRFDQELGPAERLSQAPIIVPPITFTSAAASQGSEPRNTQPSRSATPRTQAEARAEFEARLARDIEQGIAAVRARAQSDPQGLLDQYGLSATTDGYVVTPNAMVLISHGLQPGDRITEINGQPIGNIAQDQQRVDAVLSQPEIQLTLVRGAQVFRITQALRGF